MWLILILLVAFGFGRELKVLYQDGRIGIVKEQALKSLKSQVVYAEGPKPLWLKDEILRGSSIGVWVRGQKSYNLPVRAGQVIGVLSLNTQLNFSGPCSPSGTYLNCFSDGSLSINASSSEGRLLLFSENYPLSLLTDSYWLGTSARFSGKTGENVVVAVADSGIDLCHPEFEDRIILFYDVNTNQELNQDAIRQARQRGDCDYDFVGHGTAVAGILAGKSGIAPKASIVVVRVADSNGAITDIALMRALDYLSQKKQQMGKPMVVSISLGNTLGPADGTDLLDLYIDRISGPGFVVVAANGNEGHLPIRAVIEGRSYAEVPISLTPDIPFEVWYGGSSSYRVELCDQSGRCAISEKDKPLSGSLTCVIGAAHQTYPLNGKVYARFDHSCSGAYTLKITLTSGSPSRIDLFGGFAGNSFGAFTVPDGQGGYLYTVSQPATAKRTLSVGALTIRALNTTSPAFNSIGMLAFFSSRGPTVDGRTKPDVVAGGYSVYTASEGGQYGYEAGTSLSAPVVAGLVALMLQTNPSLTPEQARELLCQNALKDSAVGNTPNNLYGCGKAKAMTSEPSTGGTGGGANPGNTTSGASGGGGGGGCSTGSHQYLWSYFLLISLLLLRRLICRGTVHRARRGRFL